ncbi:MAG: cytochrome C oxidase Cbb3, partial [Alphaproteobacteria bacterium]|nr:cytochrome C oxidase Cbb3 [Alphaproteobacteria bacterium]
MKRLSAIALLLPLAALGQEAAVDPLPLFKEHCAECHGAARLGGMGPALIPENLGRLRRPEAAKVIAEGRALTQMPGFADKLNPKEIEALVAYAFTPLKETPRFTAEDIAANHTVEASLLDRPPGPVYSADPLNLFVVVEQGDSHATLLDGDKLEPIHRFPTRFALHGGPKFSPDGRFVYFASRDGWITKYDLHALEVVAETRAGINTRNLAISGDGRTVLVGNYLPHTVVLLDARDLSLIRVVDAKDRLGKESSRVSAVYQARPRNSFIVALKDIPELWEISWLDDPPPVYSGFVHSWEKGMVEGHASKGRFPIRRILL